MSELTISEASRTFDVHPNILSRLVLGGRLVARETKMVDSTLKAAGVEPLRDGSYGEKFLEAANWLGIQEVLTAPQSPSQNSYVERLIGSIRRECLDHVIVLNETGLRRTLKRNRTVWMQSKMGCFTPNGVFTPSMLIPNEPNGLPKFSLP